ncbi:hypothetical protein LCGC14_0567230 [marine sediment metagenome]|uniref:Uncharacterized protein n=1 Tax=marine sediment metagenome TaxID=412755 RepID=A0A0F9U6L0_9ZZZZ
MPTIAKWDALIRQHSLHLKYDSQLFFLEESLDTKIPRVSQDLFEHRMFPDAIKREIYLQLVDSGEIEVEPLDATKLNPASRFIIDSEYLSRLQFYQNKVAWLKEKLETCQKEMELRADGLVVRKPIGTTYYVDFTNGHDVNNDGTTAVKTNGDGPWATLDKAATTLAAGDVCIVRRGMTQTVTQDLNFTNDGTIASPITIEADYGDAWGDLVDLSITGTATLTFGSKTVTFSADVSGVLVAGDWIYASGDAAKDFAYEVASVSTVTVTLYLPYKGGQAGSGKTMYNLQDAPIWNTAAGDYEVNFDNDHFWRLQGLHLRGTDTNGVVENDSSGGLVLIDMIIEGNGVSDWGLRGTDDVSTIFIKKTRFYNFAAGLTSTEGTGQFRGRVEDCLLDGNNVSLCSGYQVLTYSDALFIDTEFKNHDRADITCYSNSQPQKAGRVFLRNCLLTSALEIYTNQASPFAEVYSEDHDGTLGDNRQLTFLSTAEGTPILQSETTKVRAGGGASSIKVTPSTNLIAGYEFSKILLFEYPIYAVKDVEKTYTAYLSSDDDTDWDADPTNTELWIEAEYWGHATNKARKILKSTGVCNNFNADDTIWDTLTVTVTPLQTGVLYLRGYYCKPKEATNANIFFCDTKIGVS